MTGCEDYKWFRCSEYEIRFYHSGNVAKLLGHVSACTYSIVLNNVLSLV